MKIETAPQASRPAAKRIQRSRGFIFNLAATFANNPTVLAGCLALAALFEKGSFSPRERQIIPLAARLENHCGYCATAHATIAKGLLTSPEVIAALREDPLVPDAKLNALENLVRELVRERGYVKDETVRKFLAAGYKKRTPARRLTKNDQQLP